MLDNGLGFNHFIQLFQGVAISKTPEYDFLRFSLWKNVMLSLTNITFPRIIDTNLKLILGFPGPANAIAQVVNRLKMKILKKFVRNVF